MDSVIIHNVAVNGGDELLLLSAINSLKKNLDINIVSVSTNNKISIPFIPVSCVINNCAFISKPNRDNNFIFRIIEKKEYLPYRIRYKLSLIFDKDYFELKRILKNVDVFFLSPGGFIHDYYKFEILSDIVERLSGLGKKIFVLGQSVGPFRDECSRKTARRLFDNVDKIILREGFSKQFLDDLYGGCCDKAEVYTDLAFGYEAPGIDEIRKLPKLHRVLVNFREWRSAEISNDALVEKAVAVIQHLASKGYGVDFLSTCQGVPDYRDDTVVADQIEASLALLGEQVDFRIFRERLSVDDYIKKVAGYKYYIGMRMHAAIMPILANVPALNIGYEPKTRGVYKTVGLDDFVLDIRDPVDVILKSVEQFLSFDYDWLCEQYRHALELGRVKSSEAVLSLKPSLGLK